MMSSQKAFEVAQLEIENADISATFSPKEIVWARFGYDIADSANDAVRQLELKMDIYRISVAPSVNINDYADRIASGAEKPDNWSYVDTPMRDRNGPADIGVTKQCYVIIELKKNRNWQFATDEDAITMKNPYAGSNYNLMHVVTGRMPQTDVRPFECRVVYFSVVKRLFDQIQKGEKQKFNFHIEMLHDTPDPTVPTFKTKFVIDPDIGNTGNTSIP